QRLWQPCESDRNTPAPVTAHLRKPDTRGPGLFAAAVAAGLGLSSWRVRLRGAPDVPQPFLCYRRQAEENLLCQTLRQLLPEAVFLTLLGQYVGFVVPVAFAGCQAGGGDNRNTVRADQLQIN